MLRTFALATALVALSLPALAGTNCDQPYAPDTRSGATLTMQDVLAMRDDAKAFMDASDLYQQCLVKAARLNPSFTASATALINHNQGEKLAVGSRVNAAIT